MRQPRASIRRQRSPECPFSPLCILGSRLYRELRRHDPSRSRHCLSGNEEHPGARITRSDRAALSVAPLRLLAGLAILSLPASGFAQPNAPAAPLVLPGSDATSLNVSWAAPEGTITSYDVRYRDAASAYNDPWEMIEDETGLSVTITTLEENTAYNVGVRATDAGGDGAWSPNARGYTNAAVLVSNWSCPGFVDQFVFRESGDLSVRLFEVDG